MILETVLVGPMGVNCYILAPSAGKKAVIIDPGDSTDKIRQVLLKHRLNPEFIINTHGHYDHIGGNDDFGLPVYVHKADLPMLKDPMLNLSGLFASPYAVKSEIRILEDSQVIELDGIKLKVLHVPGHTPGGIALLLEEPGEGKIIFTGDTLFCQGVGRSDLIGGDEDMLYKSIKEKLFTLPDDTIIYPGHGEFSTIGQEKNNNLI